MERAGTNGFLLQLIARLKRQVFMRNLYVLIIVACLMGLIGCKGKPGIVGEWTTSQPGPQGAMVEIAIKFGADKSYSMSSGVGDASYEVAGTYTYDESTKMLTITPTKMKIMGKETTPPAGTKTTGPPTAVTWTSPNEISLALPNGAMVMKRKS